MGWEHPGPQYSQFVQGQSHHPVKGSGFSPFVSYLLGEHVTSLNLPPPVGLEHAQSQQDSSAFAQGIDDPFSKCTVRPHSWGSDALSPVPPPGLCLP